MVQHLSVTFERDRATTEAGVRSATSRGRMLTRAALAFFVITFHSATQAAERATPHSLLILYSNRRPLPANVVIDDTLRRVVPEALGRQLEIYSEFLDVEHFSDAIYAEISADFLGHKYSRSNVGVIVTIGAEALQFLLRYRGRVVPNAPVVHINMTQEELREMQLPPDVVGWTVDLDPAATLALASSLHPHATRLVFVSGASDWDRLSLQCRQDSPCRVCRQHRQRRCRRNFRSRSRYWRPAIASTTPEPGHGRWSRS